jgi:Na+/H+-dicarboxylate symporter/ABC-type amino acid transport substrate-binding protein
VTSSAHILIGLFGGILTGLFFGEATSAIAWVADGFIKLLQMMVLPYITVSIVASLGSLQPAALRALGLRAAAVIGGLWLIALGFAFLIPLTFPPTESASFFSSSLLERQAEFDFIDLYVPANPFHALANNIVPAVVLFSIVLGSALAGVEDRARLLDVLQVARAAIARATRAVTRLTPYGLFAIAANAAGTLQLQQLERLQIYLIAYVTVALLVSLWVLPGLVAALTPIRAADLLRESRDSLITAAIAGDLFIVLPGLTQASRTLLDGIARGDPAPGRLVNVIVPASFNFPHTGKLLSLSFILFAGWFADASVPVAAYPQLAVTGMVTFFGSLTAAIPFLLDLSRIPADTFQLFIATGVVNARVGSLLAAVHTVTVAVLAACAVTGHLRWRRRPLVRYAAVTLALVIFVIGGTRYLFATALAPEYSKGAALASMQLLRQPVAATRAAVTSPAPAANGPALQAIRSRGVLRVGYLPHSLPFAFDNSAGELVGFDVELAHDLARELGVTLAFVPIDRDAMAAEVNAGTCDLVMSGVAITTERSGDLLLSDSYLDETLALIVPDHARDGFGDWSRIRTMAPLTIAVLDVPYYSRQLRELLPHASITTGSDVEGWFAHRLAVDAFAMPAERGSAWTLRYPAYAVVVPGPEPIRVPLAYPIGRQDAQLARFVNTWIALKRKDGTLDAAYRHWILGLDATPARPRWSIVRDVLHWME